MNTKVLIVDDEVEFASTLSERLTLRDYDAKAVYCAEDAIAVTRTDPPDVVLLDLKIPGMSGEELFNIIKKINPAVEIIILTGQLPRKVATEGKVSGAFDYIVKPVDIDNLIVKINNASKKKSLNRHKRGKI